VMTSEQTQAVIERADAGKLERARKLLASRGGRRFMHI
jgi:hypothetical protein